MPNEVLSTAQLKKLVKQVVVAQGNNFIKDLLRATDSKIGVTKQDFIQNLDDAIDEGRLTQARLEAWLGEVEGWGDQYVYVLSPPVIDAAALTRAINASPVAHLNDAAASPEFPEDLELSKLQWMASICRWCGTKARKHGTAGHGRTTRKKKGLNGTDTLPTGSALIEASFDLSGDSATDTALSSSTVILRSSTMTYLRPLERYSRDSVVATCL